MAWGGELPAGSGGMVMQGGGKGHSMQGMFMAVYNSGTLVCSSGWMRRGLLPAVDCTSAFDKA
jgi:hypothetical protein